jgi:hypothetical protein
MCPRVGVEVAVTLVFARSQDEAATDVSPGPHTSVLEAKSLHVDQSEPA